MNKNIKSELIKIITLEVLKDSLFLTFNETGEKLIETLNSNLRFETTVSMIKEINGVAEGKIYFKNENDTDTTITFTIGPSVATLKFMNKEKYNQIVHDAYIIYLRDMPHLKARYIEYENKWFHGPTQDNPHHLLLSKEEFIDLSKTDDEFSKTWGLKIVERKLSQSELNILYNKRRGVGEVDTKYSVGTIIVKDPSIPLKLITISYNNETIEIYE